MSCTSEFYSLNFDLEDVRLGVCFAFVLHCIHWGKYNPIGCQHTKLCIVLRALLNNIPHRLFLANGA